MIMKKNIQPIFIEIVDFLQECADKCFSKYVAEYIEKLGITETDTKFLTTKKNEFILNEAWRAVHYDFEPFEFVSEDKSFVCSFCVEKVFYILRKYEQMIGVKPTKFYTEAV